MDLGPVTSDLPSDVCQLELLEHYMSTYYFVTRCPKCLVFLKKKTLNFGNHIITKFFQQKVHFSSTPEVAKLSIHNVKLMLEVEVVSMAPVLSIIDKAESLVACTQAQINLVLQCVS